MTRQWKELTPVEAVKHPLYGVKNWLALLSFAVIVIPVREFVGVYQISQELNTTVPELLSRQLPAVHYVKLTLILETLVTLAFCWMILVKYRYFRNCASGILLALWPTLVFAALMLQVPPQLMGETIARSFAGWLVGCAVWVTYLQRSERVRVTFEHCELEKRA